MPSSSSETEVAIIGAGPAGLTAAYILGKHRVPVVVFEADPALVGGISRTVSYKGYSFDIGGHRFFSKSQQVEDLWSEILPDDFLQRPRSSRIYYRNKFFSYPLKAFDALSKLGLLESTLCVASYGWAKLKPVPDPTNLEDWVTNQFGKRLFSIFFKTYTEKVWGMPCKEISADWAAQRIKGLSLGTAILHSLGLGKSAKGSEQVKTLIESFRYPRKGPGMMWDAAAAKVRAQGGTVEMGHRVDGLHFDEDTKRWTVTASGPGGEKRSVTARHVISSAPIRELIKNTTPALSERARKAAEALHYRDFLIVALMIEDRHLFDDNWIYIHDPTVRVGRIQNFRSWSPEMVPPTGDTTCYGMEYFCFENDGMWARSDADLIELAKGELETLGLGRARDVLDGYVVRQKKAYPVYDDAYARNVAVVREELEARLPTLHLVGRNGMHKYNNQDHAMMTAMLTAENILAGKRVYDVWNVNQDAEYHEAGAAGQDTSVSGLRMTPTRVP
jgi:protoporphyrinogen oxidase